MVRTEVLRRRIVHSIEQILWILEEGVETKKVVTSSLLIYYSIFLIYSSSFLTAALMLTKAFISSLVCFTVVKVIFFTTTKNYIKPSLSYFVATLGVRIFPFISAALDIAYSFYLLMCKEYNRSKSIVIIAIEAIVLPAIYFVIMM